SLRPGYWVVFSGVYGSLGPAQRAAAAVPARFHDAFPRPVVPRIPVARWRTGGARYTLVLASLPVRAGAAAARAEARRAAGAGLRGVGVLLSTRFRSLQPGFYVVFAGAYRNGDAAQKALARVSRIYPGAYPRAIG